MPSTTYGPPFDHDDADIILRSSDQIDFHVYQAILSASSPFFKSMFSLPQPNTSALEKNNPVVDLSENSRTIATLLTFIYPVISAPPEPESLDDIIDALVAANKYDMAFVSRCLNQIFTESKFVQGDPMVAFCAAYSRELGETCHIAAKASLKYRMNLDNIVDKLQYMNGPAFDQLYEFHRACSATTAQAVSGTHLTWITKSHSTWWGLVNRECKNKCLTYDYILASQKHNSQYSSAWLGNTVWVASAPYRNFITRAHNALLEQPCQEAVTGHQFFAPCYKVEVCGHCQLTLLGLPEFSRLLGKEIERRVSEVSATHLLNKSSMISTEG
jgi:hypothetical protein